MEPHQFLIAMVAFIIIALFGFIIWVGVNDAERTNAMQMACEAKNGALLDHTTRVGKHTHHEYVCIDKNLIIEYKTDAQ